MSNESKILDINQDLLELNQLYCMYEYPYAFSMKDKVYASSLEDKTLANFCMETKISEKHNKQLAGDIENEFRISDTVAIKRVKDELKLHLSRINQAECTSVSIFNEKENLDDLWVNYQKKYEFNPSHHHSGVVSFVIYVDIPEAVRQEYKDSIGNSKVRGIIQFHSSLTNEAIYINPSNNNILLFESSHVHQVYPFYSDETRISIAGNIYDAQFK